MQNPFKIARDLRNSEHLNLRHVSVDTVKRKLRRLGLPAHIARNQNLLKTKHKNARIKFAEDRKNVDWTKVIFSDEKTLQNYCHARQYMRRPRNQASNPKYVIRMDQTRRFKVNLWGYIGAKDCGLVNIEGETEGKKKQTHRQIVFEAPPGREN